jgi:4-amino-4-deoxy-L-arabinose transferase-like glycosyltransferase
VTTRSELSRARSPGLSRGLSRTLSFAFSAALFVFALGLLLATTDSLGYARDEGFYFTAARRYQAWFELLAERRALALDRRAVDAAWVANHEHPGLMKSLFALSNAVLHERWGLFERPGTSFRFPAMALAAAMVVVVHRWLERRVGALFGLVGALSLLFMPRVFYHAHLACFDVPITALYVFVFFAWQRALEAPLTGRRAAWPIVCGLTFGAALATKHNAWFLPVGLIAHLGLTVLRRAVAPVPGDEPARRRLARGLTSLGAMAALGPTVFFATWPWLWFDTRARLAEYVAFHVDHVFYNMEFLGQTYFEPPFPRAYAPMMMMGTVSTITLVLGATGGVVALRALVRVVVRRRSAGVSRREVLRAEEALLWILGVGLSLGPWVFDTTPIFGGTKHWMPAYPFLAMLAATGAHRAARAAKVLVRSSRLRPWVAATVALLAVVAPMRAALHAHPWGLTAYTPIVGGAQGAATLGLNRTFWGYPTDQVMDDVARVAPRGAKVFPHDTARASWEMLREDGVVGKRYEAVWTIPAADFAVYHHEQHMQVEEYQAWVAYETVEPLVVEGLDGVPVVWVYRRP